MLLLFICLLAWTSEYARADSPQRTELLAVGPYVVDANLYQDPPFVDQAGKVTIVPHDRTLRLQGEIIARPGLGTDAVDIHARLKPADNSPGVLQGNISMPVQGAWQLIISLDGPQGHGEGSFAVTVAAPGAIPIWLGWLIGVTPTLGIAWWIWRQHRYRRVLLTEQNL